MLNSRNDIMEITKALVQIESIVNMGRSACHHPNFVEIERCLSMLFKN